MILIKKISKNQNKKHLKIFSNFLYFSTKKKIYYLLKNKYFSNFTIDWNKFWFYLNYSLIIIKEINNFLSKTLIITDYSLYIIDFKLIAKTTNSFFAIGSWKSGFLSNIYWYKFLPNFIINFGMFFTNKYLTELKIISIPNIFFLINNKIKNNETITFFIFFLKKNKQFLYFFYFIFLFLNIKNLKIKTKIKTKITKKKIIEDFYLFSKIKKKLFYFLNNNLKKNLIFFNKKLILKIKNKFFINLKKKFIKNFNFFFKKFKTNIFNQYLFVSKLKKKIFLNKKIYINYNFIPTIKKTKNLINFKTKNFKILKKKLNLWILNQFYDI